MKSVFIDGQAGTTGLEISQRLLDRTDVDLLQVDPARRKDPAARLELMNAADLTILCLPDQAALDAVGMADPDVRILDASTAHRVHGDWIYGCPELLDEQRELISSARLVSNPGCYPQGFILLVRPLIEAGILSRESLLTVFGLSGYSGGGRGMIERYQAFTAEQAENWNTRTYALNLSHKHLPEMRHFAGLEHTPVFSPVVGNYYRGMLIEVPLHIAGLNKTASGAQITDLLAERYQGEPFVEVLNFQPDSVLDDGYLNPTATNGTNNLQLMVFGSDSQLLLTARYDNLGKGASGAAVQNLNLMLGFEEQTGLAA
jgi:N-acetyl-gamma-glutamyl-phosphate reductase